MNIIAIIVLSIAISGMAIGVAGLFLRHYLGKGRALRNYDVIFNALIVKLTLRKLNCTYKVDKDQKTGDWIFLYDYQSGHFRLRLEKDSPYVRLSYLFFFSTTLDHIALVRNLCNQCSINSEICRVVYSLNTKQNLIDLHIVAGLLLTMRNARAVLEREMTDMFSWQNTFVKRFNELEAENQKSELLDLETESAERDRVLFLLMEEEMMHQNAGPSWRDSAEGEIRLETLVTAVLGIRQFEPVSLKIFTDGMTQLKDADQIRRYEIGSLLVEHGQLVRDEATLVLDLIDLGRPYHRELVVHLNSEKQVRDTVYYRITLTLVPLSWQRQLPAGSRLTQPYVVSFLAAYDFTDPKERLAEFHLLWEEALEKSKKGETEKLTEEQKIICECTRPRLAYLLFRGKRLFLNHCFYEALHILLDAFHLMQSSYLTMKEAEREYFYEVCYLIGFSYCELKLYRQAYYYLDILLPLHRVIYTEELVNCLVNSHDFRAISFIDGLLEQTLHSPKTEENQMGLKLFVNFLKRRKACVYIDLQRYEEAESLLKQMLDDPDNTDFVIGELAYLQRIKGGK